MNKIVKELEKIQNIILVVPDENYKERIMNILKGISLKKKSICFVSVNKTKKTLEKEIKEKKINQKNIYFIDCISKSISKGKISWSDEKTQYIDNPNSLTQISLAILKLMEKTKIDYLILDSINTLLIYNNEKSVLKFVHHTTGKLKENSTGGILVYLKQELDPKLLKAFAQFSDKVIESDTKIKENRVRENVSMDSFEEIKL